MGCAVSSELRALFAALLLGLLAAPASAQDADEAPPEEEEVPEEPVEDPDTAEARRRFTQALELADAGNCEGALAELNAALAIVRRPSILYNIARCQERLNRYDLAIAAYRSYLDEAPADDPDRPRAEATVEQLGRLLGTVHVRSNVPAEVWVNDRVVGEAPGDVLVPGGRFVLELRADGYLPSQEEVEVAAGSEASVEIELQTAQQVQQITNTTNVQVDAPPLPPELTIAMIVASVATVGVGVGFGVNAIVLSDEQQARDARLPRMGEAIDESALFADIFFIAGGVLGAATIAMAFLTDWEGAGREAPADEVTVTPLVGPLFAGVRVEGLP